MANRSRAETSERREKLQQYIRRGIENPTALAQASGFTLTLVKHDLKFFRDESDKWHREQAKNGYIWSLQKTEDQLQNMIEEQQKTRNQLAKEKIVDTKELRETTRLIAELMSLKFQVKTSAPAIGSIQRMLERTIDAGHRQ